LKPRKIQIGPAAPRPVAIDRESTQEAKHILYSPIDSIRGKKIQLEIFS